MINYNVDSDGIATITWDMPGRTMNVLNEASMTAYAGAIEEAIKDDKVKGIILTSAKADFIAGADLEMLLGTDTSDAAKLMDQFSQLQKMFRRQETGGKPIVAAINGTALPSCTLPAPAPGARVRAACEEDRSIVVPLLHARHEHPGREVLLLGRVLEDQVRDVLVELVA